MVAEITAFRAFVVFGTQARSEIDAVVETPLTDDAPKAGLRCAAR